MAEPNENVSVHDSSILTGKLGECVDSQHTYNDNFVQEISSDENENPTLQNQMEMEIELEQNVRGKFEYIIFVERKCFQESVYFIFR